MAINGNLLQVLHSKTGTNLGSVAGFKVTNTNIEFSRFIFHVSKQQYKRKEYFHGDALWCHEDALWCHEDTICTVRITIDVTTEYSGVSLIPNVLIKGAAVLERDFVSVVRIRGMTLPAKSVPHHYDGSKK